jgi:uncharacterized OB-fold protein
MSERVEITPDEIARALGEEQLREWVEQQRWYASKSRHVTGIDIVETITLRDDPLLLLALVQTRFATGTHELYQLPLALRSPDATDEGLGSEAIAHTDEWTVYDALAEPAEAIELLRRIESTEEITTTGDGHFRFHQFEGAVPHLSGPSDVRLMGVEQSNSSVVFDDTIVLKVFRKLEPGVNPELEVLRFLTWRGFLKREPPRRPDPQAPAAPPAFRAEAWKFGFTGSRCQVCGTRHLPPTRVCLKCHAVDRMTPERMADVPATIATYTVDRLAYSLSPPVVVGVLDFEGGGRFTCELTDVDPAAVAIGNRVEMTFRRLMTARDVHNYFWKCRPAGTT